MSTQPPKPPKPPKPPTKPDDDDDDDDEGSPWTAILVVAGIVILSLISAWVITEYKRSNPPAVRPGSMAIPMAIPIAYPMRRPIPMAIPMGRVVD